jgi:hypothetical protein
VGSAETPAGPRLGGVLTGSSVVARRRQDVAGDLEGVAGKVPGKEERAGAHQNGGSMVRRCKRCRVAVFIDGEGASMVTGGGDEVLQLGRGEGVRKLQEIAGIGSTGRSSLGSGGQRRCPAEIHEGEGAANGRRWRSGCGERWRGSGTREEESERSGDGRTSGRGHALSGAVGSTAGRERKERGVRPGKCHVARDGIVGPGPDRWAAPRPCPGRP